MRKSEAGADGRGRFLGRISVRVGVAVGADVGVLVQATTRPLKIPLVEVGPCYC
jgi:hypothetical protein